MQSQRLVPRRVRLNHDTTEIWLPSSVWEALTQAAVDRRMTLEQLSSWIMQVHGRPDASVENTFRYFSILQKIDPETALFRPLPRKTSIEASHPAVSWNVVASSDFWLNGPFPSRHTPIANCS